MYGVISRVGAALSQLIKPVASSASPASRDGKRQPAQSFKKFQNPDAPLAKVIPLKPAGPAAVSETAAQAPALVKLGQPLSVAHSFILLLSHFKQQRTRLLRWIGSRAYHDASVSRNRLGKYRKGAMLDRKAE